MNSEEIFDKKCLIPPVKPSVECFSVCVTSICSFTLSNVVSVVLSLLRSTGAELLNKIPSEVSPFEYFSPESGRIN